MRSAPTIDVRTRIEQGPRVITIAAARPVEETWSPRARVGLVVGSSAALWAAIGMLAYHFI